MKRIRGFNEFGAFTFNQGAFSGNAFADLLLGLPYSNQYALVGPNISRHAIHTHLYAQDEWRVSSRLTVGFGLRWSLHPPMAEQSGNITNFDRNTSDVIVPDRTLPAAPGFLSAINACPGTTVRVIPAGYATVSLKLFLANVTANNTLSCVTKGA